MKAKIDHKNYYRVPWNLADNAIIWLECTKKCNLYCDGCYRQNVNDHKPLEVIKQELNDYTRLRTADGVSIAGGDPLTHPDVIEIVRMVKKYNLKPILNTNGLALTPELLKELKKAGVFGFTFHIDSKQNRPNWKGKNEIELNELRLQYAEMLASAGNLSCSFNATVYGDTLQYVPDVVEWGQKHIDIVNVLVFIAYRAAVNGAEFDYYAGNQKIDVGDIAYSIEFDEKQRQHKVTDIQSTDIMMKIREKYPDFDANGYLNGTERPDTFKWFFSTRVGQKDKIYGYPGPKFMEIVQNGNHLLYNRYLAYASPKILRRARMMFLLAPFDKRLRKTMWNYLGGVLKNPLRLFRRLHVQNIMMIQPADLYMDGGMNMCDGCPDITIHEGKLVWSCRLEELFKYGTFMNIVPKDGYNRSQYKEQN
jgi:pyruvate-formate lyase-activating enzyme